MNDGVIILLGCVFAGIVVIGIVYAVVSTKRMLSSTATVAPQSPSQPAPNLNDPNSSAQRQQAPNVAAAAAGGGDRPGERPVGAPARSLAPAPTARALHIPAPTRKSLLPPLAVPLPVPPVSDQPGPAHFQVGVSPASGLHLARATSSSYQIT